MESHGYVDPHRFIDPHSGKRVIGMGDQPVAVKDRILDIFARVLREHGESAATFEEIAVQAGLSKSGVLHHFSSKQALVDALVAKMLELNSANLERIARTPGNPIALYLRDCMVADDDYSEVFMAVTKLSGTGIPVVSAAMETIVQSWQNALAEWVGDPVTGGLVQLVADGLYLHAQLGVAPANLDVHVAKLVRDLANDAGVAQQPRSSGQE